MVVNRRLHALAGARGATLKDLDIRVIDRSSIDLTTEGHIEALMDTVAGCRPDLLVLDPLRMLHTGDEDSSTEMIKVLQVLRDIQEQHHCSVFLIHHDTKRAEDRQHDSARARGSSALAGWRDYRASVRQTKDGMVWVNPYAREAPPLPSFAFRLVEKDSGKQISLRLTAVKEPGATPEKKESPKAEVTVSQRATARLTKLVEANPRIPVATLAKKLGKRNEFVLATLKAAGWARSRGPHGSWKRSPAQTFRETFPPERVRGPLKWRLEPQFVLLAAFWVILFLLFPYMKKERVGGKGIGVRNRSVEALISAL